MTVIIKIGRRVPKSFFRRLARLPGALIAFQENIWVIIGQSLTMAKKKASHYDDVKFVIVKDKEKEDLHWEIEWIKVIIQSTKEKEEEEYNEALRMYSPLKNIFKKGEVDHTHEDYKRVFNTKMLSMAQIEEAYKKGYGSVSDNNISQKLLEMGILTHIEWIKDFDNRIV